jgi:hypothetical protein
LVGIGLTNQAMEKYRYLKRVWKALEGVQAEQDGAEDYDRSVMVPIGWWRTVVQVQGFDQGSESVFEG